MVFKRQREDSDEDYVPPKPKTRRMQRANSLPASPMAPQDYYTPPRPSTPENSQPDASLSSLQVLLGLSPARVASGGFHTPQASPQRAQSLEPPMSSPMSSVVDMTPVRDQQGRVPYTPHTRGLTSTLRRLSSIQDTPSREEYQKAEAELEKRGTDAAVQRVEAAEALAA
ncbi:hypothetical protein DFH09DRAFT_1325467 [Mycena vulgaris]|nr:hypothetical protein DFH09DRAFT_1325467 [Mycena vulgaris]